MKSIPRKSLFLYIACVVILLTAGGYAFFSSNKKTNNPIIELVKPAAQLTTQTTSSAPPTTTPQPVKPEVISTAAPANHMLTMKEYSNANLGFAISYSDFFLAELNRDASSVTTTLSLTNPDGTQNGSALIEVSPTEMNLDQYISDLTSSKLISDQHKTTIAGIPAYEGVSNGLVSRYGLFFIANEKAYRLTFYTGNDFDTVEKMKSNLSGSQKEVIATFALIK